VYTAPLSSLQPPVPSPILTPTIPLHPKGSQVRTATSESAVSLMPLTFLTLMNTRLPSRAWNVHQSEENFQLFVYRTQRNPSSSSQPLTISHSVTIAPDFSCKVAVHGHEIESDVLCIPPNINESNLQTLLEKLEMLNIYPGHPDKQFVEMVKSRNGHLLNSSGQVAAYLEGGYQISHNNNTFTETVRSSTCLIVTEKNRCEHCTQYRDTIRSIYYRWSKQQHESLAVNTSSHVNERQKDMKASQVKCRFRKTEKKCRYLEQKIKESIEKNNIEVDKQLSDGLHKIMKEHSNAINQKYEKNSFHHLFWSQQLKNVTKKPKQCQWHPMLIRWCLHLKMLSTTAYDTLRRLLVLPCGRTLRDYTHYTQAGFGVQAEVTKQLMEAANMKSLEEHQKYVAVIFDEMRIKDGLLYNKHEARMEGFVDLGKINNILASFQQSIKEPSSGQSPLTIAKHMLVFMVRDLFINLEFPYAQYPTSDLTADSLFPLVWEVIRHLEVASFKVVSLTADNGSCNPKSYCLHHKIYSTKSNQQDVTYKVPNPYTNEKQDIFFISDVPHLIKTVWNTWSNSFGHNNARALWVS